MMKKMKMNLTTNQKVVIFEIVLRPWQIILYVIAKETRDSVFLDSGYMLILYHLHGITLDIYKVKKWKSQTI
jgi:hypothetical protein